ncbi:IS481 family transposase [Pseudoduganella plicata]|nr:IS481 family transposase [Pseudoduganella plicata]
MTFIRRVEMVEDVIKSRLPAHQVAQLHGVSAPTVRKWVSRFLAEGKPGLADRSSRPDVSPRAISPQKALTIVELRKKRMTQARIAEYLSLSKATVSRVLTRAGVARPSDLEPTEPVKRYEHERPGDMIHIDTKKLGRIEKTGHRATGNRRDRSRGAGWEVLFVAVDDHTRIAYTELHPDESQESACRFLKNAHAYYCSLGAAPQRLLTDNGSAFRAKSFNQVCTSLEIRQRFTRPYRPQTNGKAERFIQSALREWAYGFVYKDSKERADMLRDWIHHYNWHRPHQGIGGEAPMSRLSTKRKNLLQLHS